MHGFLRLLALLPPCAPEMYTWSCQRPVALIVGGPKQDDLAEGLSKEFPEKEWWHQVALHSGLNPSRRIQKSKSLYWLLSLIYLSILPSWLSRAWVHPWPEHTNAHISLWGEGGDKSLLTASCQHLGQGPACHVCTAKLAASQRHYRTFQHSDVRWRDALRMLPSELCAFGRFYEYLPTQKPLKCWKFTSQHLNSALFVLQLNTESIYLERNLTGPHPFRP